MKTKFTLVLLYWISLLLAHGQDPNAVVCEDVYLTSQAEVNAFNCTEITGTLSISGSDITDLSPLQNLTKVGQLFIEGNTNLTNVDGLGGLQFISTYGFPYSIVIENNHALKNLDGLSGLAIEQIGWLRISNNPSLESINFFTSVKYCSGFFEIINNASLKSFLGFRNLNRIQNCVIDNNPELENIDGLASLKKIAGRHASIYISNNAKLRNIDGLASLDSIEGFGITIENNSSITNIDGLRGLTYLGGGVSGSATIHNNEKLENIDGLSNLKLSYSTGHFGVKVTKNPSLIKCDGIIPVMISYGLALVEEPNFTISENGSGCTLNDILNSLPPTIFGFSLYHTPTQSSSPLRFEGLTLNVADEEFPDLRLRAETDGDKVGSVEFRINDQYAVVDNEAPFLFDVQLLPIGTYTVVSTPYSLSNKQGIKGNSSTIGVSIYHHAQINHIAIVDLAGNWIKYLRDGDTIDLKDPAYKNFAAVASGYPDRPAFMKFWLDDALVATEYVYPYALAGDSEGKIFNAWKPKPGIHTLRIVPFTKHLDKILEGTALQIKFEVIGEPTAVISFNLVDTSGKILKQLKEGDKINIGDPTLKPFTIVANTTGQIGSVRFKIGQTLITENVAPYTLAGDNNGYYNPWKPSVGNHSVSATPYSNAYAEGEAGKNLAINFTVVNEPPFAIVRFDIVNTSGKILKQLREGDKINLNDPAYKTFTIVATVTGKAGSVKFKLDQNFVTENVIPYSVTGDNNNGYYNPWNASLGSHTISAVPYLNSYGQGTAGKELKVNFSVVKENTTALGNATVSLYPIPMKEELSIEVKNSNSSRFSVTLRNSHGYSIHSGSYDSNKTQVYKIMTSGLSPGIYFLQLRDSNGSEKVIRVMK